MKINYKLFEAEFIDRPNQFLTIVKYNNKIIKSHLPDPGRLKELLKPGSKVLIKKENGINRKTKYSTQAIYKNNILISLNTLLPNKYVEFLINNNKINSLKNWEINKKEIKYNQHRFDFQLIKKNKIMIVEIKSVTLVEESIAKFPDAITIRAKKHVKELGEMAQKGISTMILFVVQRPDAFFFKPKYEVDPNFCKELYNSYNCGLKIKVIKMKMNKNNIEYKGELKYKLDHSL